jgi:hypothetical protein
MLFDQPFTSTVPVAKNNAIRLVETESTAAIGMTAHENKGCVLFDGFSIWTG